MYTMIGSLASDLVSAGLAICKLKPSSRNILKRVRHTMTRSRCISKILTAVPPEPGPPPFHVERSGKVWHSKFRVVSAGVCFVPQELPELPSRRIIAASRACSGTTVAAHVADKTCPAIVSQDPTCFDNLSLSGRYHSRRKQSELSICSKV